MVFQHRQEAGRVGHGLTDRTAHGPYKTKEDAEHAWDIVVDRNARWEEENRRWKNYGVKPAQARPED